MLDTGKVFAKVNIESGFYTTESKRFDASKSDYTAHLAVHHEHQAFPFNASVQYFRVQSVAGAARARLDHSSGGKISMAKSTEPDNTEARCGGCWEDRRCGRREESKGSIWAGSHECLNRCFTMAFCFACFIEQRADIHVNLALLQSARSNGGYTDLSCHRCPPPPPSTLPAHSSSHSLHLSSSAIPSESYGPLPFFIKLSA